MSMRGPMPLTFWPMSPDAARAGFLIVDAEIRIPDHEIEAVAERLNHRARHVREPGRP